MVPCHLTMRRFWYSMDSYFHVCMYVEMFIQGYPCHNSGNYGVPVVKKLVKKKVRKQIILKDIFYIFLEKIQLTGTF